MTKTYRIDTEGKLLRKHMGIWKLIARNERDINDFLKIGHGSGQYYNNPNQNKLLSGFSLLWCCV